MSVRKREEIQKVLRENRMTGYRVLGIGDDYDKENTKIQIPNFKHELLWFGFCNL